MSEAAEALGYTWNDYRHWGDDQRREIIDGEMFAMTPAPAPRHQMIQGRLNRLWDEYLEKKHCRVLPAPIDVKLSDITVVQPDLIVVCRPEQILRTHVEGAPALVVEILSESTALYDRTRKLRLYARSGVREVWLVTPYPWLVEVLSLDGASYRLTGTYTKGDTLESPAFPDLRMDLGRVFDFPISPDEEIEMVREGKPPEGYVRRGGERGRSEGARGDFTAEARRGELREGGKEKGEREGRGGEGKFGTQGREGRELNRRTQR